MALSASDWAALILAVIVVLSGLAVVTLPNLFHCALLLGLSFVGMAGLYLVLHAEFLAAAQVLIYAGAITILILFAVMLTQRVRGEPTALSNRQKLMSLLAVGALYFALVSTLLPAAWRPGAGLAPQVTAAPSGPPQGLTWDLGTQLLTTYLIPFEVASLLLLAALVGAVVLAKEDTP